MRSICCSIPSAIGDIAMQCGFEDSNYFRWFSREIGMSPGQWRQQSRRRLKSVVVRQMIR